MLTPVRIDVETGESLPLTDTDPYTLPWVQGAASTLPRQTRAKYPSGSTDLQEKLSLLKSRRPVKDDFEPLYGPQPRPWTFRAMDQEPGTHTSW